MCRYPATHGDLGNATAHVVAAFFKLGESFKMLERCQPASLAASRSAFVPASLVQLGTRCHFILQVPQTFVLHFRQTPCFFAFIPLKILCIHSLPTQLRRTSSKCDSSSYPLTLSISLLLPVLWDSFIYCTRGNRVGCVAFGGAFIKERAVRESFKPRRR